MLNDISGIFQDTNGMGSVEAARMAAEDFNGGGKGIKVEIVYADHQNKADVGSAIARKWLDVDGVDAIVDVPNSAVGLTINSLLRDSKHDVPGVVDRKLRPHRQGLLAQHHSVGQRRLGHRQHHGGGDDGARRQGLVLRHGRTTRSARASRPKPPTTSRRMAARCWVRASIRSAPRTSPRFLLQAQNSKAKVIGLANAGGDTINAVKQAAEFGIQQSGQTMVAFLLFVNDVHGMGLKVAQGLQLLERSTGTWTTTPAPLPSALRRGRA